MRSLVSPNAFWNRRLDPLDWKRVSPSHDPRLWDMAYRTFLDPATRDAIELLGDPRGKRLLEIGCGQGHGTAHLLRRGASVTGVDVSDRRCRVALDRLDGATRRGSVRVCAASAERLPFPGASFDLVFCRDVLMYADPERVLADCHRVLVEGGRAAFVEALEGHVLLRWFRRLTSPADYLSLTRHLTWRRMRALGTPLERISIRPYYLLSPIGFLGLFCLRSVGWHRFCLASFEPLDRRLLATFPIMAHLAWRAAAVYRKPIRVG